MSSESNTSQLIRLLQKLSKIDTSIARSQVEQRRQEENLEKKQEEFTASKKSYDELNLVVSRKLSKNREEEERLKMESQRLVERRKVLSTFSDYKVQQSAQKEIEQAAKQISSQEEKLLTGLDDLEKEQKELADLKESFDKISEEFTALKDEHQGEIDAILERINEKLEERKSATSKISQKDLTLYEKVRNRHPMDPLAVVNGANCGGCFMKLAPQLMVQVSRASGLMKCRGCSRILYIDHGETAINSQA